MPPELSQAALALGLEFVADISYNPRTNQYRIDLVEPYRSELPKTQNFLTVDVKEFTVDKLLALFDHNVVKVYEGKYEAAKQMLVRAKESVSVAPEHSETHSIGYTPSPI
jgi:hypothetical protein